MNYHNFIDYLLIFLSRFRTVRLPDCARYYPESPPLCTDLDNKHSQDHLLTGVEPVGHRIITARKKKSWRQHFFHQIEPNWPLPYSSVPVPLFKGSQTQRAGSPIAVYAQVQCQEPKTGQQKVQFYCEDDLLFWSSYYLSMLWAYSTYVVQSWSSFSNKHSY